MSNPTHTLSTAAEPLTTPPRNLRYVEPRCCVTCVTGGYDPDAPTVFYCRRPDGPVWRRGAETDHVCDWWVGIELG